MSRASPGEATAKPSSSRMRRAFATCAAFDSASCPRPSHKLDRKSTRLNSSHGYISYAVFCLKKIDHAFVFIFVAHSKTHVSYYYIAAADHNGIVGRPVAVARSIFSGDGRIIRDI